MQVLHVGEVFDKSEELISAPPLIARLTSESQGLASLIAGGGAVFVLGAARHNPSESLDHQ
jgi:hypothetical protein